MTSAAAVSAQTFGQLLERSEITQGELAAHLNGLDSDGRINECRQLSGRLQKKLWAVCAGAPTFSLDNLIPSSLADGQQVIWAGKNSLAAFSHFEKRFARQAGQVVGYNFQSMSWLTGPGYFTVVESPKIPSELLFDYTAVPTTAPAGWPKIKPNSAGLSRLVYKDLHDFCRRVADDVIIGSATRLGKDMNSYFVLARR